MTATTENPRINTEAAHTHEVRRLADLFIEFLCTNTAPDGLFADDVFCDLTVPTWRLQAVGPADVVALRRAGHPATGRVPRHRLDATATGFVLEVEEAWEDGHDQWYCRELFRADVADGRIRQLSIYCTGDWDSAQVAEHAAAVTLIRP